jgi:hypothetical protein
MERTPQYENQDYTIYTTKPDALPQYEIFIFKIIGIDALENSDFRSTPEQFP